MLIIERSSQPLSLFFSSPLICTVMKQPKCPYVISVCDIMKTEKPIHLTVSETYGSWDRNKKNLMFKLQRSIPRTKRNN